MTLKRKFLFIKRDKGTEESTLSPIRQIIIFGTCVPNNVSYFYERVQKKNNNTKRIDENK
jgi:hypothetical protein